MAKREGFTLIELLVVIAIIALLMSMMMPALNRVRRQAKSVMCCARLKEWGLLFKLYTDDYEGNFFPGWDIGETTLWMNALRPYYKYNWAMLLCPMATRIAESDADWGTFKAQYRNIALPGGGSYLYVFSYSENSWINNMTKDRGDRKKEWFWKSAEGVKGAYNVPVFADATWHDAWPRDTDFPPAYSDEFGWGNKGTTDEISTSV